MIYGSFQVGVQSGVSFLVPPQGPLFCKLNFAKYKHADSPSTQLPPKVRSTGRVGVTGALCSRFSKPFSREHSSQELIALGCPPSKCQTLAGETFGGAEG